MVMFLIAAIFVGVNARGTKVVPGTAIAGPLGHPVNNGMSCQFTFGGWPIASDGGFGTPAVKPPNLDADEACQRELEKFYDTRRQDFGAVFEEYHSMGRIGVNAAICLAIVLVMGALTEFLIAAGPSHATASQRY
jgi:hypothetical protein